MTNQHSKLPIMVIEDSRHPRLHDSLLAHNFFKNVYLVDSKNPLQQIRKIDLAAVVLDLDLPTSNGLELLKLIASRKPELLVIVVTGAGQIETAVECMKLGAADYLTEPISVERLSESIRSALNLRCLKEVASLLRNTPCKLSSVSLRQAGDDCGPAPFTLPKGLPERLRKAVSFMEVNLSKPLTLERIAEKACLSKYHFSRQFKKYMGISPTRFMMNRRVCQSTLLLQNKELSISRVAINSGFSDQSEFTKWFKKITGFTPSWYRKSFGTRELHQFASLR